MTCALPAVHQMAYLVSQSRRRTKLASSVVLMLSPTRKTRVCPMRVASKTGRPSTGHRYHSATSSPAPGALPKSLGLLHESENLPLRPYQKIGSDNEDIPHEGHRQNRSAIY